MQDINDALVDFGTGEAFNILGNTSKTLSGARKAVGDINTLKPNASWAKKIDPDNYLKTIFFSGYL
jgi:hypothetical protein